jgi:lysophospholipase L1-like esterase
VKRADGAGNSGAVRALNLMMTTSPTPLRLAVFGDSIAYGQGASDPSDTIGMRLAAGLRRDAVPTELRVFAVPRARSDALDAQLRAAREWRPQLAVIIIGANDLTNFVPADQAVAALGQAVGRLRDGGCTVVVVPAPDLSVVPWVPPQWQAMVRSVSTSLRAGQVRAATAAGARVADVNGSTAALFAADQSLFSADRFHPSSAGYAVIAAAIEPAVRAAAAEVTARGSG